MSSPKLLYFPHTSLLWLQPRDHPSQPEFDRLLAHVRCHHHPDHLPLVAFWLAAGVDVVLLVAVGDPNLYVADDILTLAADRLLAGVDVVQLEADGDIDPFVADDDTVMSDLKNCRYYTFI